jgi:hypothetical protein
MIDRRSLVLAIVFAGAAARAIAQPDAGFNGVWRGALQAGPQTLRLRFDIRPDDQVVVNSLDQGNQAIPARVARRSAEEITIEAPSVGGRFTGRLAAADRIVGTWTQGGAAFPLTLDRGDPGRG